MIKLVIFDMDGLLIDSEEKMWVVNETKVIEELGYQADNEFLHSLMGSGRKTSIERILNKYGKDFDIDRYFKLVDEYNDQSVKNNEVPLKEGVHEILNYLKENNIDYCIGSSSNRKYVDDVLKSCEIYDEFKNIITGDDVNMPKPEPDIYLKCMSYYPYNKDEVLVLEDAHNGALSAYEAGCRFIIVKDVAILEEFDYENSLAIVDSLLDVIKIISEENERATSV